MKIAVEHDGPAGKSFGQRFRQYGERSVFPSPSRGLVKKSAAGRPAGSCDKIYCAISPKTSGVWAPRASPIIASARSRLDSTISQLHTPLSIAGGLNTLSALHQGAPATSRNSSTATHDAADRSSSATAVAAASKMAAAGSDDSAWRNVFRPIPRTVERLRVPAPRLPETSASIRSVSMLQSCGSYSIPYA